jgi:hypothetical protein
MSKVTRNNNIQERKLTRFKMSIQMIRPLIRPVTDETPMPGGGRGGGAVGRSRHRRL